MRNYVIINGVNSLTIQGLAINNLPPITKPMIRTQREEIDGRDGDIVTELGYSAYDKQIEIGLWGTYDINDIIKYFTGEGTIVFSNEEDKYYNFKILDQIDYQKLLKFKTATITFHCQPFKYPLEEEPVEAEITTLTGTGETITLNNTEEAPMKIVLKGNTSQESTTGKNLLQYTLESLKSINTGGTWNNNVYTWNGITFTVNDDLSINVNGTATAASYIYVNFYNLGLISGTEYILNGCPSGGRVSTYSLRIYAGNSYSSDLGNGLSFTFNNQTIVRVNVSNGTNVNNLLFQPMIRLSSVSDSSYEMYTNGASPNPDYPQDIHVVSGDNTIIVSNGDNTQSQSYPISLGDIELCKIGNYQDYIAKSTGENLFDNTFNHLGMYQTASGQTGTFAEGNQYLGAYIKVEAGKTYSISRNKLTSRFAIGVTSEIPTASTNCLAITRDDNALKIENITIPDGYSYLILYLSNSSETSTGLNIMINEGSTALPYEPYGTSWYLKKEIGKVDLGTLTWISETSYLTGQFRTPGAKLPSLPLFGGALKCNQFIWQEGGVGSSMENGKIAVTNSQTAPLIRARWKNYNSYSASEFKDAMSGNMLYYSLATPTYTEITDSTLISQLEALNGARSYTSQTNISQENNDLPFELDVSVTFLTPMEINNIGNIYAKPILTIEGTGNIGVVLNDIQILEIDLTNNGKIAIDVTKLEAYNPDDDTLLNRLVTGDYMKLLINEGENTITFTGNVSGATLTNYIRWI